MLYFSTIRYINGINYIDQKIRKCYKIYFKIGNIKHKIQYKGDQQIYEKYNKIINQRNIKGYKKTSNIFQYYQLNKLIRLHKSIFLKLYIKKLIVSNKKEIVT